MAKPRVYLTGGDNMNWALDDDLRMTHQAIQELVEFTSLKECDVVHSMWWAELGEIPDELLLGKRIICHVPGEPFRYLKHPAFSPMMDKVGLWIGQNQQAVAQLNALRVANRYIPYAVNADLFHPLPPTDPQLAALRQTWAIPDDRYLIVNFHRDTEGSDLTEPKLVKGPDIFAEIVHLLNQRGQKIHVVLAGPRRFWLRRRLEALGIPYTYIGKEVTGQDDIAINILPQSELNLLYNLGDLYIVSSRSEGGPRSILEAALARCKMISTAVGMAPDLLQPTCLYRTPMEAAALIEADIAGNTLGKTLDLHQQRALDAHLPAAVMPRFADLYREIATLPIYRGRQARRPQFTETQLRPAAPKVTTWTARLKHNRTLTRIWRKGFKPWLGRGSRYLAAINRLAQQPETQLTVSLWHKFYKPPHGGGNQFMLALEEWLAQEHVTVLHNQLHEGIDAYLLNSIHFDVDSFLDFQRSHRLAVVHRIDGPIHLIRGYDRDKDELAFRLNATFASATVLQSHWSHQRLLEMGFDPVNPVVIHNGVNPQIFHRRGKIPFARDRKIRLISSSWSDNPRKGGPVYKWIEEHLDWERFEYTFVGRASEEFTRIKQIEPVPSEQLADLLRQHDIYITASQNDPCSNALIEALACGLPALYFDDGGHPELVDQGGLPFRNCEEIPHQLDQLVENYEIFQSLITVATMRDVAQTYLTLLRNVARSA
ncbi:MAG: glycosyltransferase family 4 protein [Caldilineaceae bacterium]|nr:glycosyltransferase family 4 protein [Caldilineaceae bacterium]